MIKFTAGMLIGGLAAGAVFYKSNANNRIEYLAQTKIIQQDIENYAQYIQQNQEQSIISKVFDTEQSSNLNLELKLIQTRVQGLQDTIIGEDTYLQEVNSLFDACIHEFNTKVQDPVKDLIDKYANKENN